MPFIAQDLASFSPAHEVNTANFSHLHHLGKNPGWMASLLSNDMFPVFAMYPLQDIISSTKEELPSVSATPGEDLQDPATVEKGRIIVLPVVHAETSLPENFQENQINPEPDFQAEEATTPEKSTSDMADHSLSDEEGKSPPPISGDGLSDDMDKKSHGGACNTR
ncbi:MAG: hypothetical protein IPN29_12270 [Saprospiraceae bacterium]|nr:hypothetical protein [Saprospiraceae bacterium]